MIAGLLVLMLINAQDFGVNGQGDNSPNLQACIDAAAAAGKDVHLPPHPFRASVTLKGPGQFLPNLIGRQAATHWYSARDYEWALRVEVTDTNIAKNWRIESVSFRDHFLRQRNCGLCFSLTSGPVRIVNCDFRYCAIGCASNGTYASQFDSCNWTANCVGLLNTVRRAANPLTVCRGRVACVEPKYLQHSGINQLNNCAFNSNQVGWMLEDTDRDTGGPHLSSMASNCIFQGRGVGVWNRNVQTAAGGVGLQFNTCHWEAVDEPGATVEIDGQILECADAVLNSGRYLFINGGPRRLIQGSDSFCQALGIGNLPRLHKMPSDAAYFIDTACGYRAAAPTVLAEKILTDALGGPGAGCFAQGPRRPVMRGNVLDSFSGKKLPVRWGLGVSMQPVEDDAIEVTTTRPDTGIRTNAHSSGGYWYYAFEIQGENGREMALVNHGNINARWHLNGHWQAFHGAGLFSQPRSFVRLWLPSPGQFKIRNFQLIECNSVHELLAIQMSGGSL